MDRPLERRAFEFRAEGDPSSAPVLVGTVIPYGERAIIGGRFSEEFTAGGVQLGDVVANVMHVRERPLARLGTGLTLTDGDRALTARLELPDTQEGRDTATLVRQGVLKGFSAEFRAIRDRWEGTHRVIEAARLNGLGVVDSPAYAGAVVSEGRLMLTVDHLSGLFSQGHGRRVWRSL